MRENNMRSNVSQDLVGFRTASPLAFHQLEHEEIKADTSEALLVEHVLQPVV